MSVQIMIDLLIHKDTDVSYFNTVNLYFKYRYLFIIFILRKKIVLPIIYVRSYWSFLGPLSLEAKGA